MRSICIHGILDHLRSKITPSPHTYDVHIYINKRGTMVSSCVCLRHPIKKTYVKNKIKQWRSQRLITSELPGHLQLSASSIRPMQVSNNNQFVIGMVLTFLCRLLTAYNHYSLARYHLSLRIWGNRGGIKAQPFSRFLRPDHTIESL